MYLRPQAPFDGTAARKRTLTRRPALARRSAALSAALLVALTGMIGDARAARDADLATAAPITGKAVDENLQLVVLEVADCVYCNLFRRYIVPAYETSPKSRSVPMKFVDMNDKAYDDLGLDGPVDTVPTTVLMHNNKEVGRIPGYLGPENFFHAFNHLMARVD